MVHDNLEVRVCGAVRVARRGGEAVLVSGKQPQSVLVRLALDRRHLHHEELASMLWGDRPSDHWPGAIRGLLTKLRRTLTAAGAPEGTLRSTNGVVWLEGPVVTDLDAAHDLGTTVARLDGVDVIGLVDELEDAVRRLGQPFLPHDDSEWARTERYRIGALRDRLEQSMFRGLRAAGELDEAVRRARRRLAESPTDEATHTLLIDLLLADGPIGPVIEAYRTLERMLAAEYRAEPDAALRRRVESARNAIDGDPPRPQVPAGGVATGPSQHRHPNADEPFVGRVDERRRLTAAVDRVVAGGDAEVVVIRGPAGIGKTRLADELAAGDGRLQVLWGRSRATVDRSFGAVADAIAAVLRRQPATAERLASEHPGLHLLLPDLVGPGRRDEVSSGEARTLALGAGRAALAAIVDRPTVLLLDDLQWASEDALALLDVAVLEVGGPLLVVATHRDTTPELAATLATLQRHVRVQTLTLGALSVEDLAAWCRESAVETADLAALHRRTGGVPYFAAEVVRDAWRRQIPADVGQAPDTLRDWIERQLQSLSPDRREVIEAIAVLDADADTAAVEALTERSPVTLSLAVDDLVRLGLVVETDRGGLRMQHDLTTSAVYGLIGPGRRAVLHRLAGDHLRSRRGPDATLAYHYDAAGPAWAEVALAARLAAGDHDLARGAWWSAHTHFSLAEGQATEADDRVRALIGIGTAWLHQNRHDEARAALHDAIAVARDHDRTLLLAEAALVLVGRAGRGAGLVGRSGRGQVLEDDTAQRILLSEVAERLHAADDADERQAVLLSRVEQELALAQMFTAPLDERAALVTRSLARIRRSGRPAPNDLAHALLAQRMVKLAGAEHLSRLGDIDEVLALPTSQLSPGIQMAAHAYRHEDLLGLGRITEAQAALAIAAELAERFQNPYWRWVAATWTVLDSVLIGDLDRAEALAATAAAARPGIDAAIACLQVNLVDIRLFQGRAAEVIDPLRAAAEAFPHIPTYRAVLALVLAEADRLDDAATEVATFHRTGWDLPADSNRFLGLAVLAHAAVTVGHLDAAAALHQHLLPFQDQLVAINCYGGGGAFWGPTSWALARTAAVTGRPAADVASWWRAAADAAAPFPLVAERVAAERTASE